MSQLTPPDVASYAPPLSPCRRHVALESGGLRWRSKRQVFGSRRERLSRRTTHSAIGSSFGLDRDLSESAPHHSSSHTCSECHIKTGAV